MRLAARVEGVGLVGPGLGGWEASRAILAGREPYVPAPTVIPAPEALPAVERRRAGKIVKLALAAGLAAAAASGRAARDLAAVFTSSTGDGDNLHAICEALASDDRLISPTRFHNSVHNAPSGYWGIATGAMHPADSIAAFDASFGAGLIEAMGRVAADPDAAVVLISYDAPYPEPLHATRPIADGFAVALVLSAADSASRGARIHVEAASGDSGTTTLREPALEALRRSVPAARSLPLLALLASDAPGRAVLEYLDGMAITIEKS
jgi:hypothetical protein